MKYRVLTIAVAAAAILVACAGHDTGNVPSISPRQMNSTTSGTSTTVSGPIVAIRSSSEFEIQGGSSCGYLNIFTNSSTTFTPSGATPAVGENSVDTGTGSCATSITASSVALSTPTPAPTPPTGTPTPFPNSYVVGSGQIMGTENMFTPNDGDTSAGGNGQTLTDHNGQPIPCNQMSIKYHIHAFVAIIVNGRQYALPDGLGMENPGADVFGTPFAHGYWTGTASCFYYIHMHDASGVIHVESTSTAADTTSIYTLGDVFKVWGQPLSSTQVGPFTGTLHVYVAKVPFETDNIARSAYAPFSGDPSTIPIFSHTAIWLEIGSPFYTPSSFPVLGFYESR